VLRLKGNRLFHCNQTENLQQMVLNNITNDSVATEQSQIFIEQK